MAPCHGIPTPREGDSWPGRTPRRGAGPPAAPGQAGWPGWGSHRLRTDLSPPPPRRDRQSCATATARWPGARPAGLSCQGKEAARRPARSGSHSASSRLQLLSGPLCSGGPFPTSARLRSRLPRSPQCFLPSLPTPPAHHSLPRDGFHHRVRQGRPAA